MIQTIRLSLSGTRLGSVRWIWALGPLVIALGYLSIYKVVVRIVSIISSRPTVAVWPASAENRQERKNIGAKITKKLHTAPTFNWPLAGEWLAVDVY
jgi:hypothetical protein